VISDRWSSLFFLAVSLCFLAAALQMPFGQPNQPGPGFMPLLLGVIMVLTSGGLLLRGCLRGEAGPTGPVAKQAVIRIVLLVVGLVLYCVLLPVVGFFAVTFLFEVAYMKVFGVRRWRTILLAAVAATLGAYLLFEVILAIPFPKGMWLAS